MGDKNLLRDYTLVCRTCLQSNVELLNLSAPISNNAQEINSQITYMECLKMCIQIEDNIKDMPARICLECASALKVAYYFMKNANQAQELLKMKLKDINRKKLQMELAANEVNKPKRYRCKICNVKVETKRSLKDHVKLHLDIIVYNCQICSFESHNRNSLSDHYIEVHGVEATKEQLKPKTKSPAITQSSTSSTSPAFIKNQNFLLDTAVKSESHQLLTEATQTSYESLTIPAASIGSQHLTSIATTSPVNYTALTTAAFSPFEGDFSANVNSDLNIANEFIVMADGSVEKVMGKGVVIEYINATDDGALVLDNGLVLDNIIQVQNIDNNEMLQNEQNDIIQMDVDDIIVEDTVDAPEEVQETIPLPFEEEKIPATFIEQRKKIVCKICTKDFPTQEILKNHMLTHNEIPHFFCDQCKFYTFFKIDLHQHYKSKHNLQPTSKQLQPKNKQKIVKEIYSCDLCFYQSDYKTDLKKHYVNKHNVEASEIHLKPTFVETNNASLSSLTAKARAAATVSSLPATAATSRNVKIQPLEQTEPDYPNGLNCRKCQKVFYWRNKLYEHYKQHNAEDAALKQEKQFGKVQQKPTSNQQHNKTKTLKTQTQALITQPFLESTNTTTLSNVDNLALNIVSNTNTLSTTMAPLTPSSSSTYTLPSDAIPQIVETDHTFENVMDFDFNCDDDALFQDFDDDVDVENDSDDNDSESRNVLLTSDDDLEEMFQEQNNVQNAETVSTESYCAHCQKGFLSQYHFENHMFVHRGLAPYRCEMCTNLYNKKRCLIRHYKAVHKSVPTRDMIQAKGDKVYVEQDCSIDSLKLEAINTTMCSKCPYESVNIEEMQNHLKYNHNVIDDSFIIKKLPFECPRCIRSFATKVKLLRHLERNHSSTPINEHQIRFDSINADIVTSAIATSTSSTSITTTINNHVNMMNTETSETSASCGKIYKVNTTASTTKFLTNIPSKECINNNNNHININT